MCNVLPNRRMAFTVLLSVLAAGCGIKWATNKVLSNPDAIAKVGAVYDVLTPRDTTERLVFIQGDSIELIRTDTVYSFPIGTSLLPIWQGNGIYKLQGDTSLFDNSIYRQILPPKDTVWVTVTKTIRRTDTIKHQLPPDNREIARLSDSLALYKAKSNIYSGQIEIMYQQNKTAEKRLIWMAAGVLLLGIVIGLLLRFKVKL